VQLLAAVAESEEGLTAKTLSDAYGLSLPTTYHLLTTLWAEGFLTKDERRVFRLGPRVGVLVEGYQRMGGVPPAYRRALDEVVARTGETAYISSWRGTTVKVLDTAEGSHAVRVVGLDRGYSDNLHARASGKLLLALASSDHRERVMRDMRMTKLTENTITTKSRFLAELEQVRAAGLAFDLEEFQLGVDCVSAPIFQGGRVDACITVSTPTQRYVHNQDQIVAALQAVTEELNSGATAD
jgi:DNA-binding IclR family transcriptional regulator